jgi:serine O-acetyltransferase
MTESKTEFWDVSHLLDVVGQLKPTAAPAVPTSTHADQEQIARLIARLAHVLFPEEFLPPEPRGQNRFDDRVWELGRALWEVAAEIHRVRQHLCPAGPSCPEVEPSVELARRFVDQLPLIQAMLLEDAQAAYDGDPAAHSPTEVIATYPGFFATMVYRLAHALYTLGVPLLPRMWTEWAHSRTGIDIHPGARIGPRFFIDHGTGVVIGETTIIGTGVTLYQGVTLGAANFPRDKDGHIIRGRKRHPTIEDDVIVYAEATILGGDTVVGRGSEIGGNVWLTHSVPPYSRVTAPTRIELKSQRVPDAPAPNAT